MQVYKRLVTRSSLLVSPLRTLSSQQSNPQACNRLLKVLLMLSSLLVVQLRMLSSLQGNRRACNRLLKVLLTRSSRLVRKPKRAFRRHQRQAQVRGGDVAGMMLLLVLTLLICHCQWKLD